MEYTQTTAPSVVPLSDANTQRRDAKAGKKGFGAPRSPLGLGAANKAPGKLLIPQQDTHTTPATPSTRWLPNFSNMVSVHDLVRP